MKHLTAIQKSKDISYLSRFMDSLHTDQAKLREIQSVYDNLTLLGQLLCAGTDITSMRNDFNTLAETLINQLALELRKKAILSLGYKARVAIDILVRNLFERTADIGFLSTDNDIRAFAEAMTLKSPSINSLNIDLITRRFDEYVKKYSVYQNIILLSPDGTVLAQLDNKNQVTASTDALIQETLTTQQAYVETFRSTDLQPKVKSSLIYSYRVMSEDETQVVGVLCLCFRFQDECQRIFSNLIADDDWTVITILDPRGYVIASSEEYQFPISAKLETVIKDDCKIVRFGGREYLATSTISSGYQGYLGPGWLGHALSPLNHAFEMAAALELERVPKTLLKCVLETSTLFSEESRNIPIKASTIQRELNRAVWNGNLSISRNTLAVNASFAKVLLWEIRNTGISTSQVFSDSTNNLYETMISSALYNCGTQSALAIDILDRNLYERANDCRWWALNSVFRAELAKGSSSDEGQQQRLTEILRTINNLYTVYSNLLIFDKNACVLAVSNPTYTYLVGENLQGNWVRQTLGLADTQNYCVSPFTASTLYDNQPAYIYSAAIRQPDGNNPIGGIAIVFDTQPQLETMLNETLPRKEDGSVVDGAFAVYADQTGRIISSTHPDYQIDQVLELSREFFELEPAEGCTNIVSLKGRYYSVGSCMSAGYREYKGPDDLYRNDILALVMTPLSDHIINAEQLNTNKTRLSESYAARQTGLVNSVEIASFYICKGWYGIRSNCVLESVDTTNIVELPSMPEYVRGYLIYADQSIPVFDLNGLLQRDNKPSESKQIIVVSVTNSNNRYGILIDELGEIPEIALSNIEAIPDLGGNKSVVEGLVKPKTDSVNEPILVILSTDRLLDILPNCMMDKLSLEEYLFDPS